MSLSRAELEFMHRVPRALERIADALESIQEVLEEELSDEEAN